MLSTFRLSGANSLVYGLWKVATCQYASLYTTTRILMFT